MLSCVDSKLKTPAPFRIPLKDEIDNDQVDANESDDTNGYPR